LTAGSEGTQPASVNNITETAATRTVRCLFRNAFSIAVMPESAYTATGVRTTIDIDDGGNLVPSSCHS
jgi:hypothetical protein